MKLSEINIRDPYILPFERKYFLYGTRGFNCWEQPHDLNTLGFDVYISDDLLEWSGPYEVFRYTEGFYGNQNFWAPEVHYYCQEFYMFATFYDGKSRGTQILKAKTPEGPFVPHSEGAVTPENWDCLDGTLYVSRQGKPFMVFCHEWKQITDGTICYVALSEDLKKVISDPVVLFSASSPQWADREANFYVTDGPFVYRMENDELCLLWSSLNNGKYVEAVATSDNGEINGIWKNAKTLLFSDDGGHGMLFKSFSGKLFYVLHRPNIREHEHPILIEMTEQYIQDKLLQID